MMYTFADTIQFPLSNVLSGATAVNNPQPVTPNLSPIIWQSDSLQLLDQRALPHIETYLTYRDAFDVAEAITQMVVRGAPAIGIAAAYGAALSARLLANPANNPPADWLQAMTPAIDVLAKSRPTAVNLFWALEKVKQVIAQGGAVAANLAALAKAIHADDLALCKRIGDFGASLIPPNTAVYTHCNTGSLATGGYGTALGVIRSAFRDQKILQVFAGETRPWMQGARLTAWELDKEGIPVTLCIDSAAGTILRDEAVSWVIVGADRVTANGDVANKIGTYNLAVLSKFHGIKFMVAAPSTTFDLSLASGALIPIEQRHGDEVRNIQGVTIAPQQIKVTNPAFDVTPHTLIDAIITEFGIIENPNRERIAAHFAQAAC
jgi:methylthioribose-1-phosphate isomerase